MSGMGRLLKVLTLGFVTLGSIIRISAFLPLPPRRHLRQQSPRRQHDQQASRSRASCAPPHWSSPATSADYSREEEPCQEGLGAETPILLSYANQHESASSGGAALQTLPKGRVLRGIQKDDIDGVVSLAFEEYYSGPTEFSAGLLDGFDILASTWRRAIRNGSFQEADVEQLNDWLEMIWLRIMIRWGFSMRAEIGRGGHDHRVFCICDGEKKTSGDGNGGSEPTSLTAVAEISLQVPNGRTCSPFPRPLWYKRLMAWPGPVLPYISNVLVHPNARRQGLAHRLMQRCEEQARDWGFVQVYLHVDVSYYPAMRMYETMGYELVSELEKSFETPRLHYMRKIL